MKNNYNLIEDPITKKLYKITTKKAKKILFNYILKLNQSAGASNDSLIFDPNKLILTDYHSNDKKNSQRYSCNNAYFSQLETITSNKIGYRIKDPFFSTDSNLMSLVINCRSR